MPCEPFPSAESPEKIRKLLKMLRDANGNMVRIWGGGLFEQDVFYDICDELGLMVTQDFLMACGSYPEWDDRFLEHLRQEAQHAARRLRNHACLMWWTGDNENALFLDIPFSPILCTRQEALDDLKAWFAEYGINRIFAYNAGFDRNHLPELSAYQWFDIMRLAAYRQTNPKIPDYADCYATGRLKRGYGVEAMLRLLSDNPAYHDCGYRQISLRYSWYYASCPG